MPDETFRYGIHVSLSSAGRLLTVVGNVSYPPLTRVGLSVDSRSADTGLSDATSVAFTVTVPDFWAC